jgi:hypothetical protein
MTDKQEDHLLAIKSHFERFVDFKYRAGAKEHGGDLKDLTPLQLVHAAKEEAVDLFVYLDTLEDKLMEQL